jgi:type VI secretion system secreted protein VgrG
MNILNVAGLHTDLTQANRPLRLRFARSDSSLDDVLLLKHVNGEETLCGGIEYRLFCVSTRADLPLKEFLALPVELQFVTDRGRLHSVCGIVVQASAGLGRWRRTNCLFPKQPRRDGSGNAKSRS